jgi:hypothetical protein
MDKLADLVRTLKKLHDHVQRSEWREAKQADLAFAAALATLERAEMAQAPTRATLLRIRERYHEVMGVVRAEHERLAVKLDDLGRAREGWLAYGQSSEFTG